MSLLLQVLLLVTVPPCTMQKNNQTGKCLKSTSKGAWHMCYRASTPKPRVAGIDITGVWIMGEGYRGHISTLVEGKKQLVIRTASQWIGCVFAKCYRGLAGRPQEGTWWDWG